MSIEPCTWEEAQRALPQMKYYYPQRIAKDVNEVRNQYKDCEPYVAELPTGDVLFLFKGTLIEKQRDAPPVSFVVTLQQPFPNSYPIITIEEPPEPWRFKNHPNVDTSGQTYLGRVSSWNPQQSTILGCLSELQVACTNMFPFENASDPAVSSRPPPPAAQPIPPPSPPQQHQPQPQRQVHHQPAPQPQPVRHQPQPQPVRQQQPVYYQQQPQRQGYSEYDAMRAVAKGTIAVASLTMGALSTGARLLDGQAQTHSRVQNRSGWTPPVSHKTPQEKQQERMQQDFILLIQGKLPAPPGSEITTPQGFGIGRFMTSRTSIDAPLLLPGPSPLPGPACTDPTPDEMHQRALEQQKLEQQRAEAAASADKSQSTGWKALSAVGRFAGKMASTAKNKVEDKVKESSHKSDEKKFNLNFPNEAPQDTLVIEYECSSLSGDTAARKGHLFIAKKALYFSGVFESTVAGADPNAPPPEPTPFKWMLPWPKVVNIMRAECCGKKFLHFLCDDNTFRSVVSFKASTAGQVGSWVGTSMAGTDVYDRAWNWIDHTWREATPVPSRTFVYAGQAGPLGGSGGYGAPQQSPPQASGVYNPPTPQYNQPKGSSSTPSPQQPGQQATSGIYGAGAPSGPAAQGTAAVGGPANSESTQCIVCMDAQKNAFFQPCGHVCCCLKCANQVEA